MAKKRLEDLPRAALAEMGVLDEVTYRGDALYVKMPEGNPYFREKENMLVGRLLDKSAEEIFDFLGVDKELSPTTKDSIIRGLKVKLMQFFPNSTITPRAVFSTGEEEAVIKKDVDYLKTLLNKETMAATEKVDAVDKRVCEIMDEQKCDFDTAHQLFIDEICEQYDTDDVDIAKTMYLADNTEWVEDGLKLFSSVQWEKSGKNKSSAYVLSAMCYEDGEYEINVVGKGGIDGAEYAVNRLLEIVRVPDLSGNKE